MFMRRLTASSAVKSFAVRALAPRAAAPASSSFSIRQLSDNITYSGGQPGVQGGFYGAGGARADANPKAHHRPEAVAAADDIRRLRETINDVTELEQQLKKMKNPLDSQFIELKNSIRKKLSGRTTIDVLKRLEINDQPVWGLTQEERELVKIARQMVNSC